MANGRVGDAVASNKENNAPHRAGRKKVAAIALAAAAFSSAAGAGIAQAQEGNFGLPAGSEDALGSLNEAVEGSMQGSSDLLGSSGLSGSSDGQPATTNDGLYEGSVEKSDQPAEDQSTFTGYVFDDANKNSTKDESEKGIEGVSVTNGRDVVRTDSEGRYSLPVYEDMNVSVTQPAGWQVPVDGDKFAQFSYVHKPEGSAKELKYGGLEPTGPVPSYVNFPMAKSEATAAAAQHCAVASDTQTYDKTEVGYASKGAPKDLSERNDYAGCGIMLLGDNVGDDLSLNPDLRSLYRGANGPVRALPGNHDQDYDAASDIDATDTYRADFGATYYSYEVGETHFIALDNIEYKGAKADGGNGGYYEKVGQQQLEWLKNDLAQVPEDKQVVVYSHAPIVNYLEIITDDALDLYDVLSSHKNVVTVGGHTHTLETLRAGDSREEWTAVGLESLPVEQIVAGAVSGDWYSGGLNENGLPHAYTKDAAEPGVYTLTFNGGAETRGGYYTVRNESNDHQQLIGVNSPAWREWAAKAQEWQDNDKEGDGPGEINPREVTADDLKSGDVWLTSSFYGGSTASTVKVSIAPEGGSGEATAIEAEHTQPAKGEATNEGWEFTDPISATHNLTESGNVAKSSPHLWRAQLPEDLQPGTYRATVEAVDNFDKTNTQEITFTVK
ncbi:hypothetical protein CUROG_01780 [Corynebacterium urogenitale]|uniref:Metallophosphoesterase n=1 Tax=Corynebacterium urogenitale TaxID=2487892 RepID=A0A5J6Z3Y2_9CORY|nr:calcineurin-like phosphoesterase C-terminal domain-containing protein [Corynebacterium urogenitale]QFQ01756.1 hypothetical protein CUROG_01780 [Corynebacterium urogenitale]